jgi:hypothetical protein
VKESREEIHWLAPGGTDFLRLKVLLKEYPWRDSNFKKKIQKIFSRMKY